jgi:hypothetical protein
MFCEQENHSNATRISIGGYYRPPREESWDHLLKCLFANEVSLAFSTWETVRTMPSSVTVLIKGSCRVKRATAASALNHDDKRSVDRLLSDCAVSCSLAT